MFGPIQPRVVKGVPQTRINLRQDQRDLHGVCRDITGST